MPFSRLRLRLAAWNLLVLSLVLVVTVGSAVLSEIRASDLAIDHELRDGIARAAARLVREGHGHDDDDDDDDDDDGHERRAEKDARADMEDEASDLLVFSVGSRGAPIRSNRLAPVRGLPDEAALRSALDGLETLEDRAAAGEPVRLLTAPVAHDGRVVGAVQVVKTLRESRGALSRTILTLILTGAAGLVLSAVGSWFLAGRAARPISDALDRQRRFIADASHELRTPVAVVRARAELLLREVEGLSPSTREELSRLHRDAEELSTLLGELLDLARLDAAEERLALEPIALGDVVEEVAAQLAPLAEERSVSLSARAGPVWARAHLGRTRQVLRALVDNAIKHTPAGGRVVIEAARVDDRARLSIADSGEGIASEDLPRVFDRFFRADAARSRGPEAARRGSGLGLSIAAQLVRAMDGDIAIESEPGKGTTVVVRLALARS